MIEFWVIIVDGWYLYSQYIKNDIGFVFIFFIFKIIDGVKLIGDVKELVVIYEYDENFEVLFDFFKNEVVFKQVVVLKFRGQVVGYIIFMVCNDVMCLFLVDFDFMVVIL